MINFNPPPSITPISDVSESRLPPTGTLGNVTASLSFDIYKTDNEFITGAVNMVSFVYHQLGGDVLDIELREQNVYSAYEHAAMEFSYLLAIHQAKNSLGSYLGSETGSFDADGNFIADSGSFLSGGLNPILTLPKYRIVQGEIVSDGIADAIGFGQTVNMYSASIPIAIGVNDYDIHDIVYSASLETGTEFYGKLTADSRVTIRKVWYKSPATVWRFFGYYGGLNVVGNLNTYGQYADDNSFEIVPVWQNKLQTLNFEDMLRTRVSHYSYELFNNYIRFYPTPSTGWFPSKIWFQFTIDDLNQNASVVGPNAPEGGMNKLRGDGVNNAITMPFTYIPFNKINPIGKQWIRRYALAISKEILSHIRGKFTPIPGVGDNLTLNADALASQAQQEKEALRVELKEQLDLLTYEAVLKRDAEILNTNTDILGKMPLPIYMG